MPEPLDRNLNALFHRHYESAAPGEELRERVDALAQPPARRWRIILWTATLAAAALLGVGISLWQTQPAVVHSATATLVSPTPPAGQPLLYWIHAGAKAPVERALLQDLTTLEINFCRVGDTIGGYELRAITPESLTLVSHGAPVTLTTGTNAALATYKSQLAAYLGSALTSGTLSATDWDRVSRLAFQNENMLTRQLMDIADNANHPLHQRAQALLCGENRQLSGIQRLIRTAERGSPASRMQAIRALGACHTPLTTQYFRAALLTTADPLLPVILDTVRQQNDPWLQAAVQELVAPDQLPDNNRRQLPAADAHK